MVLLQSTILSAFLIGLVAPADLDPELQLLHVVKNYSIFLGEFLGRARGISEDDSVAKKIVHELRKNTRNVTNSRCLFLFWIMHAEREWIILSLYRKYHR